MKQEEKKITIGALKTLRHHRRQLDRKLREVEAALTRLDHPLLSGNWTAEDAWELADGLARLMGLMARVDHTVFDERNPYPGDDALMEDIPYYNPYFEEGPDEFVFEDGEAVKASSYPEMLEEDRELWTEVLYCGILVAAVNPEFCFPSAGAFADLKELLTGIIRTGAGPEIRFDHVLSLLRNTLSGRRYRQLAEFDFGPEPPSFGPTENSEDKARQEGILDYWKEWTWLKSCPCRDELLRTIERIQSEELHDRVMNFIHWYLCLNDLLSPAIDLYLYQAGASGMLDDGFYVTYAMLCRTQKQIKAAAQPEEG